MLSAVFFFKDTATTEIYTSGHTLSLHDALPIAQKGGCPVCDLPALLDEAKAAGLAIEGLMAIPPAAVEPAPYFALLDELAERHGLPLRSMGMSVDYETAAMLGATHVRIGTALFGARG